MLTPVVCGCVQSGRRLVRVYFGLARCRSRITGQIQGPGPVEVRAGSSQREAPARMPFAERNPPDIPILPGPDFRYVLDRPALGSSVLDQSHPSCSRVLYLPPVSSSSYVLPRYLNSTPPAGKTQYHKAHSLGWRNGLRWVRQASRSLPSTTSTLCIKEPE